ncbi:MAG TPA: c-type cytochrome [Conexibacter sp.]|nr:c-type cytochrome [Conexibacter sp.]
MRRTTAGVLLALSVALLATGCGSDAARRQQAAAAARARAQAALRTRQVAAGRGVFVAHCASCHTIEGRVAHPTFIESPIPNLDEVKPKAPYIDERVRNGGFDMPTISGELRPGELAEVVAYVATISGSSVHDTSAGEASALRLGAQVFAANCTRCHTIAARPATNRPPPGFPGTNFDNVTPSQKMVVERVTRGIREEMPSFRRRLTAAQIHAVAVYVTATAGR